MTQVVYEVVEHNGGWAYRVGDTFSETFDTHDQARAAAERAAEEQRLAGDGGDIQYEDEQYRWRIENARGDDRPETEVEG